MLWDTSWNDYERIWLPGKRYSSWDDQAPLTGNGGHVIIIFDGRYYDAECVEGVDDWHDLPFYQRYKLHAA